MKKRRQILFLFSLAAQLFSALGAVIMLFKKKKGTAGFFAALGLLGAVVAGSVLNSVPDKDSKQIKRAENIIKNDIRNAKTKENENNIFDSSADDSFDTDDDSFSQKVDEAFASIQDENAEIYQKNENDGNKIAKNAVEQDEKELWRIERAINILKNAGNQNDGDFVDVSAQLEDELSKL